MKNTGSWNANFNSTKVSGPALTPLHMCFMSSSQQHSDADTERLIRPGDTTSQSRTSTQTQAAWLQTLLLTPSME